MGCGLWGGRELDTSKQTGHACLRSPRTPHPPSITTPIDAVFLHWASCGLHPTPILHHLAINVVFAVLVSCGLPHPPFITSPIDAVCLLYW